MTNEQRLLVYLYSVPDIQRRQLILALPDIPYQSLTLAVRKAKEHGYIDFVRRDRSNYIRLTPAGVHFIRQTAGEHLDKKKRNGLKKHTEQEKVRRFERIELVQNLCAAAGIPVSTSDGLSFGDLIGPASELQKKYFEGAFLDKGYLFTSDDISRTLQSKRELGEDSFVFRSRFVAILFNRNGLFFVYNTLDKLMRWEVGSEQQVHKAVILALRKSAYIRTNPAIAQILHKKPKSIIFGKSCAMIPKIWTGDKWGVMREDSNQKYTVKKKLLTYDNLQPLYSHNYFVPLNTLGVELLCRTVQLSRIDINQMCREWLEEYGEYTILTPRGYVEAYKKGENDKYIILPVLELDELVYHRSCLEKYYVVCERGTQDGISRVLGEKSMDFFDFDYKPLPVHKYDDDGVRMDGVHPLTGNGYLKE